MAHTDSHRVAVSTFYRFASIAEPEMLKEPTLARMHELNLRGTITFAKEGVNATIAGNLDAIEAILTDMRTLPGFENLTHRLSENTQLPFGRGKVKVKRELISLGAEANPAICIGDYVTPQNWNALISAPDVITIDTRNEYEYAIGHFKNALNPATRNFKQIVSFTKKNLDPKKHKRVAMYCTGGIRCEKYSSYLITQGFEQVYHLQGGILAYLETVPANESLWEGECYVFDERVAVGHALTPSKDATMCQGCGRALYPDDRQHADYIEGKQCKVCA